jgi:hypothetical protein
MLTDTPVANGDHATPSWTARHVVEMLREACPRHWQTVLRNSLGSANPANLSPGEFAKFADHVSWVVKQYGIKDPAAFLAYQVQLEAKAAGKLGSSVKIGDISVQRKSAGRGPVTFENSTATASAASPPQRLAVLIAAWGATKAEVLSRAKAAIEAGESSHDTAERLAFAREHFHASQREIGRAVGRSGSWVNRLLKWRRSRYNQSSPFGPTTRSGRAAHRSNNNHFGRRGGPDVLLFGAAGTRPNCDTFRKDDRDSDGVSPGSVSDPPPSPSAPGNENLPSGSTQLELPPSGEAAGEPERSKTRTNPLEHEGRKGGRSSNSQLGKQKRPSENVKANQMRSPERMRIVVAALKENPTYVRAAFKAGIHRKTLASWLKNSAAGHEGYDIECDGELYRFHDLCEYAIAEAEDTLHFLIWQCAMGIKYKIDPLLERRGHRGLDAYAKDENGHFIEEGDREPNKKMMLFYLRWMLPERWGKSRKRKIAQTGGVMVVGERTKRPKTNPAASIRARKWKAAFRRV